MGKEKKKAFDAACDYLSIAERSSFEVEKKLKEKGYEPDEIAEALEKLKELGFVDDKAFGRRYAEFALAKGRGLYRIKNELRKKGISSFDVEDIMFELEEDGMTGPEQQRERAAEIAAEVLAGHEPDDRILAKISRKLAGLGYSPQDIYHVLGRIRNGKKD